jgi:nicotinamide riboside kinase
MNEIDLVFFIPNEFDPPDDGVRSLGEEHFEMSKAHFKAVFDTLQTTYPTKIMRLGGSVSERIEKIEAAIRCIIEEGSEPKEA